MASVFMKAFVTISVQSLPAMQQLGLTCAALQILAAPIGAVPACSSAHDLCLYSLQVLKARANMSAHSSTFKSAQQFTVAVAVRHGGILMTLPSCHYLERLHAHQEVCTSGTAPFLPHSQAAGGSTILPHCTGAPRLFRKAITAVHRNPLTKASHRLSSVAMLPHWGNSGSPSMPHADNFLQLCSCHYDAMRQAEAEDVNLWPTLVGISLLCHTGHLQCRSADQ